MDFPKPALAIAIVVATVLLMEPLAALVHRHWMHGPGWHWHRSHHQPTTGARFERNDAYGLVFAALAVALTIVGVGAWWPLYWIGIGMTVYGVLYAVLHDGLVHRRWPLRWTPERGYLRRLIQAHRLHHATSARVGAVSFGFLYAPPVARLAAELRARRSALFETTPIAVSIPTSTASSTSTSTLRRSHQGRVGALLALLLLTAWALTLHHGLFVHQWGLASIGWAAAVVVFMCWLDVGLFIVAHDAMHGSLVPHHARLNSALGRLCMALYAGFTLGRFKPRHFEHHRHPGTANDPDFHAQAKHFWPWYVSFMRRYFGWREALGLLVLFTVLSVVLRAPVLHVLVFWALPALLSSVQLFAFGTWLPHRAGPVPFVDHHHARSNPFGWCVSLLTCFHFGYHHEHHTHPHEPWWRLPSVRGSVHPKSHQQPHGSRPRATSGTTPRATPQKTPP